MNAPGGSDLLVQARSALLDALDALREHRAAIVVIGAQAIYLHTGRADIALAEATKDSDLALDTRHLGDDPRIEQAMSVAGFTPVRCHEQLSGCRFTPQLDRRTRPRSWRPLGR